MQFVYSTDSGSPPKGLGCRDWNTTAQSRGRLLGRGGCLERVSRFLDWFRFCGQTNTVDRVQ